MTDSPHDTAFLLRLVCWLALVGGLLLPFSPAAVRWLLARRFFAGVGPSPLCLWLGTRLALALPATWLFFLDTGNLRYSPALLYGPFVILTGVADYLRLYRLAADHGIVPADPMAAMDFSDRPAARPVAQGVVS